jgi:hypothetical protein
MARVDGKVVVISGEMLGPSAHFTHLDVADPNQRDAATPESSTSRRRRDWQAALICTAIWRPRSAFTLRPGRRKGPRHAERAGAFASPGG